MGSCKDANSCEKEKTFNNLNDPSDISLKTDTKEKMNKSSSAIYRSQRPVFDQPQFDIDFSVTGVRHKSAYERLNSMKSKCQCNAKCAKKTLLKHFPFIGIMKSYNVRTELINDIIGGLTVGVMHIPQGMAYALLATVAPVYGLYVSFFPVILYFFFGTSRHGSMGTFSLSSLLVAACLARANCPEDELPSQITVAPDYNDTTFTPYVATDMYSGFLNISATVATRGNGESPGMRCRMEVATALAFITGLIQMAMGFFRLGFLTNYLSYPMTRGFTTGAATHIFSAQMKNVFGIKLGQYSGAGKLLFLYYELFANITKTTIATLIITLICVVILWCFKEYIAPRLKKLTRLPIPIDLIVVIVATILSYFFNFEERFHVKILKEIPTGIPAPKVPDFDRLGFVIADAIPMAIICFTVSYSVAKVFAAKHGYKVDANQELVAYGVCNTACSFLNCFSTCFSLSRSCVQEGAGGGTQVVGLVSSILILIVLVFLAPLFQPLPTCVLAAIIIIALKGMFIQFSDVKELWKKSKIDLSVWLVAFFSTLLFDVILGLIIGVIYSLLVIICLSQSPRASILGCVENTDIYEDISTCSKAKEIAGVKIFRYEGALFFVNQKQFFDKLYTKTGCNAVKLHFAQKKIEQKKLKHEKRIELRHKKQNKGDIMDSIECTQGGWTAPQASIHHLIIDCSMISSADSTGVQTLQQVVSDYKKINVTVLLAACRAGLRDILEQGGFFDKIDRSILYPVLHDAVLAAISNETHLRHKLSDLHYGIDSVPNDDAEPTEGLLLSPLGGLTQGESDNENSDVD